MARGATQRLLLQEGGSGAKRVYDPVDLTERLHVRRHHPVVVVDQGPLCPANRVLCAQRFLWLQNTEDD